MSNMPLTDGINALTAYANETTGASDTTLSDAVESLVAGYGGGGGGEIEKYLAHELEGDIVYDGNDLRGLSFAYQSKITSVTLSNWRQVPANVGIRDAPFKDMTALKSFSAPLATRVTDSWFEGDTALESINMPKLTDSGGRYAYGCTALKVVALPSTALLYTNAFRQCTALEAVDALLSNFIGNGVFIDCYVLSTLVIRKADAPATLNTTAAFDNTPFRGYNSLTGTLYVPSALVEDYKTANGWKTLYNAGHMTILPIEGSIYEAQYADGTPITT